MVSSTVSAHTGLIPTEEQQRCIDAFRTGENVTIRAYAGTGKTSVLKLIGASNNRRGLYLAYNRKIADEASATFAPNIDCRTTHQIAYRAMASEWGSDALRRRLNGPRVSAVETARILGAGKQYLRLEGFALSPTQLSRIAMETVQRFCYSGDDDINAGHVPGVKRVDMPRDRADLAERVLPLARQAWSDLSRPDGALRFQHDHYLKIFCLLRPTLHYDYALVDECQDSNGATTALLQRQSIQIVAVGDTFQQLYSFRGAVDSMDSFNSVHDEALTVTWRFGEAVSSEANKWLALLGATKRIQPADPSRKSELRALGDDADAVLCRTNSAAVGEVVTALAAGKKVAVVGGGDDVVAFARAAEELKTRGRSSHRDLFTFSSWLEVETYAEESHEGRDLKVWVGLIEKHGTDGLIKAMSACTTFGLKGQDAVEAERRADLLVSTAHGAKGMEWARVRISEDFEKSRPKEDLRTGITPPLSRPEAMLAYVAVTRAKEVLDRGGLAWVDQWVKKGP